MGQPVPPHADGRDPAMLLLEAVSSLQASCHQGLHRAEVRATPRLADRSADENLSMRPEAAYYTPRRMWIVIDRGQRAYERLGQPALQAAGRDPLIWLSSRASRVRLGNAAREPPQLSGREPDSLLVFRFNTCRTDHP